MEDKATQVKNWIKAIRPGNTIGDQSILIAKQQNQNLKITLLDTVCCIPAILFDKNLEDISMEDIVSKSHLINHRH